MQQRYEPDGPETSGKRFHALVEAEYASLPEIVYLDDYIHLRSQLEAMRARISEEWIPGKFAMELALLCRLMDYEQSLGLPEGPMPLSDGRGGVVCPSVVPEEWL